MSSLLQARRALGVAIVLLGAAWSREASAAGSGAQWYVELIGARCQSERPALEREIALACDAVGDTCRVASSPKEAELRAVLDCSSDADAWTLETRTIEGTVLGRIDLSGATDDRLREAAVEVARDAAPERALAVETLRTTLANEAPVRIDRAPEYFTLVAGGRATAMSGRTDPTLGGIHLLGGLALNKSARLTLGVLGEAGGREQKAMRAFRAGPGIAVGAPFDRRSVIGAAAEGGIAGTSKYGPPMATEGTGMPSKLTTQNTFAVYGQATMTVQWPAGSVRPYASLSAAFMSDDPARLLAGAEAGLAIALF